MKSLLLFLFFIFTYNFLYSQENHIDFGMGKFNSTFDWTSNFYYDTKLYNWGKLFITNKYNSTAIEGISNSFRDAEDFYLLYNYPLLNNKLFAASEINYKLILDKNIDDNNKIERISGLIGINGKLFNSLLDYKLLAGVENNTQAGAIAAGEIIKAGIILNELSIEDYKIKVNSNAILLFLNDERTNQDVNAVFDLLKIFANTNLFNFSINYKLQGRNFIQSDSNDTPLIEDYTDNTIWVGIKGNWNFNDYININYNANVENKNILRNYLKTYSDNWNFNRYYNEFKTSLDLNIDLIFNTNKHNFGFQMNGRDETNYIKEYRNINDTVSIDVGTIDLSKDNYTENMKLLYSGRLAFSKFDTMYLNVSLSKTEYNTPSIFNNDDRDEIKQIALLEYNHRVSSILSFVSKLNYSQHHLVFIKNQRSSQNNWNRILSLNTGIRIQTKDVYYEPIFEVLANYTIYDFEINNQPQSYSFRQLSYKDTALINLTSKFYISNKTSFRIYEQGKLLWNLFTEIPQQRNLELSLYPMIFSKISEKITVGCGSRFYYLKHGALNNTNWGTTTINIFSFSPEASLTLNLNYITLKCYGWLEHRYQQKEFISVIPNIYLRTMYKL